MTVNDYGGPWVTWEYALHRATMAARYSGWFEAPTSYAVLSVRDVFFVRPLSRCVHFQDYIAEVVNP